MDINKMTLYQELKELGFEESSIGPVVVSGLPEVLERLIAGRIPFGILHGSWVPEARPESYDPNTFNDNYVVFLTKSDK
jgi:hypothetical protein